MFTKINKDIEKDIRHFKRRYQLLRIKWILLFVLPILIIVLAYQVSKQFLKLKIKELGDKVNQDMTHRDGTHHDTTI
ncbi:MAG: hypothetical protein RR225_02765 [Clostridium sp.]